MKVTFFINYLNHHQVYVADELYKLLGDDFKFVATYPRNDHELKGGEDYSSRKYCLLPCEREEDLAYSHQLNLESEICVYGAGNLDWEKERTKTDKLSFEISERWFKRGWINLLSPRLIKWWWLYQTQLKNKPFYKLCASGYTARDCKVLFTFRERCYKWGYFPNNRISNKNHQQKNGRIEMIWCARFISWKHPMSPIQLAIRLKNEGCDFRIRMLGDGPMLGMIQRMVKEHGLDNYVSLLGKVPNNIVNQIMSESDIFLFTSDRNEGWGAVLNEAMSNGCCVVGNNQIGSIPYLIEDEVNGLIYDGKDSESLYYKVKYLIDHPARIWAMGQNAIETIANTWNPSVAAKNLLALATHLNQGKTGSPIGEGPCSVS